MDQYQFTIDGMRFVSGLFWQPISGANGNERRREVNALAKEMGFDLHVVRTTPSYCVGFASSRHFKGGGLSAAAVVSKTLEIESEARDFIFVSQLPDGQWIYVAQRDGVILPDGDINFTTEDAARSRLLGDLSLGEWSVVFAPAIWGIGDSVERDFVSLLPKKEKGKRQLHRWWKLVPINARYALAQNKGLLVVGALVAVALIGGGLYYRHVQIKKAEELARIEQERIQRLKGTLPPPDHPWKKLPLPMDFAAACIQTLESVNMFPGNWTIQSISCGPSDFTVIWSAGAYGMIDHIKIIQPDVKISANGLLATLKVPLPKLPVGMNESLIQKDQRITDMNRAAQNYSFSVTMKEVAVRPLATGKQKINQVKIDWSEVAWRVDDVSMPEVVLSKLNDKGLRLSSMSARWGDGKFIWTMEGTQYVLP